MDVPHCALAQCKKGVQKMYALHYVKHLFMLELSYNLNQHFYKNAD